MATTTNFGWETPDDTDLVKDGAAAIRTALGGVDTSFVDLKGGTTGQVLAKASNTDLDFVWSADAAGMTNPMTTTGDTIYSSSGSTPARLGIGSTGQVLTVAGGVPTWAAPGGALNWSLLSTTAMSGSSSINLSGLTLNNYFIWVQDFTGSSAGQDVRIRFNNSSTAADYDGYYIYPTTFQAQSYRGSLPGFDVGNIDATGAGFAQVSSAQSTGQKQIKSIFARTNGGDQYQSVNGFYNPSTVVSSIQVLTTGGTFTAGTIFLYGAA